MNRGVATTTAKPSYYLCKRCLNATLFVLWLPQDVLVQVFGDVRRYLGAAVAVVDAEEHGLRVLVELEYMRVRVLHRNAPALHRTGTHLDAGVLQRGALFRRDGLR